MANKRVGGPRASGPLSGLGFEVEHGNIEQLLTRKNIDKDGVGA